MRYDAIVITSSVLAANVIFPMGFGTRSVAFFYVTQGKNPLTMYDV